MSARGKHLPQPRGQHPIQALAEARAGVMDARAVHLSGWPRLASRQRAGRHLWSVHSRFSVALRSPATPLGLGPDGTGCSAAVRARGSWSLFTSRPPPGCHVSDVLGSFIDAHWEAPC